MDTNTRINQFDRANLVRPMYPSPRHFRADAGDAGVCAYDEDQPEVGVYAVRTILFGAGFCAAYSVVINNGIVELT